MIQLPFRYRQGDHRFSKTAARIRQVGVRLIAVSAIFLTSHKGFCADSTGNGLKRNLAFVSFGGKENFGSVNYERIFSEGTKLNWSFSVGVQPFQLSQKFSIPVSVNVFTKGRLHHLEIDVAATFFMDKFHPYDNVWKDEYNKRLYLTPFICYRLQRSRGLMLKTGIGPQVLFDPPARDVLAVRTKVLQPSVFAALGISF